MSEIYLRIRCGNIRYGLPSAKRPASFAAFGHLTEDLLQLVRGLPKDQVRQITSETARVPRQALAEALKKIGPATPVASFIDGAKLPFWQAMESLADSGPVGVALEVAPSDANDPWTGAPLCLTFCPAFGQGFQLDLPLFSIGALHFYSLPGRPAAPRE